MFTESLKYFTDKPLIYYYRSKAYLMYGAKDSAYRDMRKALEIDQKNLEFIYTLIDFLLQINRFEIAKSLLPLIEDQSPSSPLALCASARIDLYEHKIKEAEDKIKKAKIQERRYYLLPFLSGKLAELKGKPSLAIKYYKKSLKYKPFWEEARKEIEKISAVKRLKVEG